MLFRCLWCVLWYIACGCNVFGSMRDDCDQMTGRCRCRPGITGHKCNRCANGATVGPHGCERHRSTGTLEMWWFFSEQLFKTTRLFCFKNNRVKNAFSTKMAVMQFIIIIERRDYGGVLSEDCEDTEQSSGKVSKMRETVLRTRNCQTRPKLSCRIASSEQFSLQVPLKRWQRWLCLQCLDNQITVQLCCSISSIF